jgi:hypothetical protein
METKDQGGNNSEEPEREEERGEASEPDAPTGVEESSCASASRRARASSS